MKKLPKIEVWWFDNEAFNFHYMQTLLNRNPKLKKRLDIKYFESVTDELYREGTPDIIVIDTTTATNYMGVLGWEGLVERTIIKFADMHSSSQFVISSAVLEWAWSILDALILDLKDLVAVDVISEGSRPLYDYLETYVQEN